MFRTLIHPSSGACDFSVVSPHWLCVLVSMCVGVLVWLGWGGICVAGCSLPHRYHSNPATLKLQHTSKQEHTTNVVIQQKSRRLLMMDVLMSETCWAQKKWNKIYKLWHQVGLLFFNYHNDARSSTHKKLYLFKMTSSVGLNYPARQQFPSCSSLRTHS